MGEKGIFFNAKYFRRARNNTVSKHYTSRDMPTTSSATGSQLNSVGEQLVDQEYRRKRGNCNKPYRPRNIRGSSTLSSGPRPAHLKGKEIGMWYRDRQVLKRAHEEEEVVIPIELLKEIESLLAANKSTDETSTIKNDFFRSNYSYKISKTFEESLHTVPEQLPRNCDKLNEQLKTSLENKMENSKSYAKMKVFRDKLPCFKMKEEIVKMIENNQVTVLSGETGSGKTTQVCQYVLDDYILSGRGSQCNMICTQPRRISAISVAERVAIERDEPLGESIGYQIRLEKVLPKYKKGTLLYVTTGILLQWLQSNPTLSEFTHIFLDEVHERDVLSDFVITFIKQILKKRKDLKIVLMSATLNAESFSSYFGGAPTIHVPGYTFPVQDIYLEDILSLAPFSFKDFSVLPGLPGSQSMISLENFGNYVVPYVRDLKVKGKITSVVADQLSRPSSEKLDSRFIVHVIRYICTNENDGAILVFLPGFMDISNTIGEMKRDSFFNCKSFVIIPLHSSLSTIDQKMIFDRPPKGKRKIIVATNIAETSITIDDVVYVIDCGYVKLSDFNLTLNTATLESQWVSLANAKQRRGRAGRVGPGKCYKLYTKAREETFASFLKPEMQRTRLDEVILQAKMLHVKEVGPFLEKVMDPPETNAIEHSLQILKNINALDEDETLTPLGFHLARLPMDPQTGKMILMASIFSCIDPILTVAAAISYKDPFVLSLNKQMELDKTRLKFSNGHNSDHLAIWSAYQEWESALERGGYIAAREMANRNFLSMRTIEMLRDLKQDFARHLHSMNFIHTPNPKDKTSNTNSKNTDLLKAILCAGLYPNVAKIKLKSLCIAGNKKAQFHPKSVCSKTAKFDMPYFVYHTSLQSSSIFIHDATMVYPWALVFFGERLDIVQVDKFPDAIRINDFIRFQCKKSTAITIQKLRKDLNSILEYAVSDPEVIDWTQPSDKVIVLDAILKLITTPTYKRV